MKKLILSLAISCIFFASAYTQTPLSPIASESMSASVSKSIKSAHPSNKSKPLFAQSRQAQFPGGFTAMSEYLSENLQYPEFAVDNSFEGIVKVQFVVLPDGSLADLQLVKSVNDVLDASALKIIQKMPKWNPALQAGRLVKMRVIVPIEFSLQ